MEIFWKLFVIIIEQKSLYRRVLHIYGRRLEYMKTSLDCGDRWRPPGDPQSNEEKLKGESNVRNEDLQQEERFHARRINCCDRDCRDTCSCLDCRLSRLH